MAQSLNRTLFHADNLPVLRGIDTGTVDLIATDPPFNKNKDFHATPDSLASGARFADRWSWERDVHEEWVDQLYDDWRGVYEVVDAARHAAGDDMAAFICWLGVRVIEMHRVLKDTGSLYLHIDHTAHAWTKAMLDAVFGRKNFQNEIVWHYGGGGASKKRFARKHDTILFYTKSDKWTFNVDAVRVPHKWVDGQRRADGSERSDKGKIPDDVIVMHSVMPWAGERTGYPTQKPIALYERIIKASSNEGDLVLDPFAGCATTPVAAERLGRQWVGIDIWEGAHGLVVQRLESEKRMFAAEHVTYTTEPPERTDEGEVAAPFLKIKLKRALEPWQRLSRTEIVERLIDVQSAGDVVVCAGCGRGLESPFMELDHIMPRADGGDNWITNRILLCRPCNGKKGAVLTLTGLVRQNKKEGWMRDAALAEIVASKARDYAAGVAAGE